MHDPDGRVARLQRNPGHHRPEDAENVFWKLVADQWFGSEAEAMSEAERIGQLTVIEDVAWLSQFGGSSRKIAFADVLAARGIDYPTDWDGWMAIVSFTPGE